jgi:acyl-CoA thioester hydrolase
MPFIHERTFRVRYYECDAYGHVNHANYLRYMQEAAFDASAAAGYDLNRYRELGQTWLVRETDITYLRPLTYGDSLTIKTWVIDFRRVRSRRAYEFRKASTGEVVAQALTDWVYLDGQTFRPATVPPVMVSAFLPDGPPENVPPRKPFPKAPPAPPGAFTLTRQVDWRDLDQVQHVNNANYVAYFEDCSIQAACSFGWPMSRMMEAGIGIVPRRYQIEYRQPALLNNRLEITFWLSDVKRATAVRHFTIRRLSDQALLARANVLSVWIDLATGHPIRIPAVFLNDFAPTIVG